MCSEGKGGAGRGGAGNAARAPQKLLVFPREGAYRHGFITKLHRMKGGPADRGSPVMLKGKGA